MQEGEWQMNWQFRLWLIQHWLKHQPLIFFYGASAKFFHFLYVLNDKVCYLVYGKVKWGLMKKEIETESDMGTNLT